MIAGIILALAAAVVPDVNGTFEQQMAAVGSLPMDVREFIERRANCNHWAGEEPYDKAREAEILRAVRELRCSDVASEEATLKSRYSKNQAVTDALSASKFWSPG